MPDASCRMRHAGCVMPDASCQMRHAGCVTPDASHDLDGNAVA
jgi:hypothetical protein